MRCAALIQYRRLCKLLQFAVLKEIKRRIESKFAKERPAYVLVFPFAIVDVI